MWVEGEIWLSNINTKPNLTFIPQTNQKIHILTKIRNLNPMQPLKSLKKHSYKNLYKQDRFCMKQITVFDKNL